MSLKIELDPRAEQLDTFVLQCRSENHHWHRVAERASSVRRGIIREIEIVRRCPQCETTRTDVYLLPTYELRKRRYNYEPAFVIKRKKGDPRLTKQACTAAYLTRELKELFA